MDTAKTPVQAHEVASNTFSWRVPAIDGVRALAMLMVYSYHVWQFGNEPKFPFHIAGYSFSLRGLMNTLPAGVDLFMVLSGFCLFLPLCKSEKSLWQWDVKQYFVRRVRRIVPPYYVSILYFIFFPQLLVLLFRLLHIKADWQDWPSAFQLVTHVLFIHTFFVNAWDGLNSVYWSLGLEAQFYLVFPLVVLGFRSLGIRWIAIMVAISILYRIVAYAFFPHAQDTNQQYGFLYSIFFLGRWMQFALGMAAAYVVSQHWKAQIWRSASFGTAVSIWSVALYLIAVNPLVRSVHLFPLRDLLLACCFSSFIVALCVSKTPVRMLFENKAMVGLGFISYSFFLIHQPTAYYTAQLMKKKLHLGGEVTFLAMCSVGFLIVLAVSYLFFLAFEKPFLSTGRRNNPQLASNSTASAAIQDQAAL